VDLFGRSRCGSDCEAGRREGCERGLGLDGVEPVELAVVLLVVILKLWLDLGFVGGWRVIPYTRNRTRLPGSGPDLGRADCRPARGGGCPGVPALALVVGVEHQLCLILVLRGLEVLLGDVIVSGDGGVEDWEGGACQLSSSRRRKWRPAFGWRGPSAPKWQHRRRSAHPGFCRTESS
jgi:hypothetical protein